MGEKHGECLAGEAITAYKGWEGVGVERVVYANLGTSMGDRAFYLSQQDGASKMKPGKGVQSGMELDRETV